MKAAQCYFFLNFDDHVNFFLVLITLKPSKNKMFYKLWRPYWFSPCFLLSVTCQWRDGFYGVRVVVMAAMLNTYRSGWVDRTSALRDVDICANIYDVLVHAFSSSLCRVLLLVSSKTVSFKHSKVNGFRHYQSNLLKCPTEIIPMSDECA